MSPSDSKKRSGQQDPPPSKKKSLKPNQTSSNDQSPPQDITHIITMSLSTKNKQLLALTKDRDLVEITDVCGHQLYSKGPLGDGNYHSTYSRNPTHGPNWVAYWWTVPLKVISPMTMNCLKKEQNSVYLGGLVFADFDKCATLFDDDHLDCETGKVVRFRIGGYDYCEIVAYIDGWPRSHWSQVDINLDYFQYTEVVLGNVPRLYLDATVTFLRVGFKYTAVQDIVRLIP